MFKSHKKGFTLIELLVVITIIGVLSTIVIASLTTVRKKARDTRRISDIKSLQLALELYYDSNRAYPTAGTMNAALDLLASNYISSLPKDPVATTVYYRYSVCSVTGVAAQGYHLGASLEETSNQALTGDSDAAADGTNCTSDFGGGGPIDTGGDDPASPSMATSCNDVAGDGTEACYDIKR